jgi:hypothetical protein
MKKPESNPMSAKVKIKNALLINLIPQVLAASIAQFFEQPLPVLARIDLKIAFDEIAKRFLIINEAHIALLKKHGAIEKNGSFSLASTAPTMPAFNEEYRKFAEKEFELPIERQSIPACVLVGGKEVAILATEPAATLLEQIVEWVR